MVVLLIFRYMSSIVILTGAELNSVIDRRYDPATVRTKAPDLEHQLDPLRSQERAREMVELEQQSPADYGVTSESERRARAKAEHERA
jgi:hypothetical protein